VNFFLKKLVSQERRRAGRRIIAGLVAYYWDGGRPTAHNVKDISLTGLYMLTQDRWYPGTIIQLTLQETDKTIAPSDRWIIVHAKVVRQGPDGVGLLFAPAAVSGLAEIVDGEDHETREKMKG
jgi:hypothetical protein